MRRRARSMVVLVVAVAGLAWVVRVFRGGPAPAFNDASPAGRVGGSSRPWPPLEPLPDETSSS